jgi:hypothetical protein
MVTFTVSSFILVSSFGLVDFELRNHCCQENRFEESCTMGNEIVTGQNELLWLGSPTPQPVWGSSVRYSP